MRHEIYRVIFVEVVSDHTLRVGFDDGHENVINFESVLAGELYGPLRDPAFFSQVTIDPEVHTLVWPNGADFDPATLHDWQANVAAMRLEAAKWELVSV